jgi:hypothetical protein
MRAKFEVYEVKVTQRAGDSVKTVEEEIRMRAVSDADFDEDGASEDNDFARWTPSGELTMTITNPALFGRLHVGYKFYLDFTRADA